MSICIHYNSVLQSILYLSVIPKGWLPQEKRHMCQTGLCQENLEKLYCWEEGGHWECILGRQLFFFWLLDFFAIFLLWIFEFCCTTSYSLGLPPLTKLPPGRLCFKCLFVDLFDRHGAVRGRGRQVSSIRNKSKHEVV